MDLRRVTLLSGSILLLVLGLVGCSGGQDDAGAGGPARAGGDPLALAGDGGDLEDLIKGYRLALTQADRAPRHVSSTLTAIRKTVEGCGIRTLSDLQPGPISADSNPLSVPSGTGNRFDSMP